MDYDVAYLVAKHVDTPVVELYIVSFQSNVGEDGEDWKNDEEGDDGDRVDYNDTWWDDKWIAIPWQIDVYYSGIPSDFFKFYFTLCCVLSRE
jgi:hypothetical protein